jgi:hypothetical protein
MAADGHVQQDQKSLVRGEALPGIGGQHRLIDMVEHLSIDKPAQLLRLRAAVPLKGVRVEIGLAGDLGAGLVGGRVREIRNSRKGREGPP